MLTRNSKWNQSRPGKFQGNARVERRARADRIKADPKTPTAEPNYLVPLEMVQAWMLSAARVNVFR